MATPTPTAAATLDPIAADRLLVRLLLALYLLILVRTAWTSDDAFITLRTVENFLGGHGLTWNTFERVQAYTHPLWMLLLSGVNALVDQPYFTAIVTSIVCAFAAVRALARGLPSAQGAQLAVLALLLCRSFVDYSTSGLENPLIYLLLAAFVALYGRPGSGRLVNLTLVAALLLITRLDALLLVGPALAYALWSAPWRVTVRALLLGLLPFFAWELFSLVYYGFLFPNTAYAKLAHQIPAGDLLQQGFVYYFFQLGHDPLSLALIGAAIVAPFVARARHLRPLALGLALYCLYILKIGGDFMAGRFFAAPVFLAVALLGHLDLRLPRQAALLLGALLLALGLGAGHPTFGADVDAAGDPRERIDRGVTDERLFYFEHAGLVRYQRGRKMPHHPWLSDARRMAAKPEKVYSMLGIGMIGQRVGPDVRLVDVYGLADPLIARLPALAGKGWRIGHFTRHLPAGYLESLESGEDRFADRDLAEYNRQLRLITSGPLFAGERWAAIWGMHTGAFDHLIDVPFYQDPRYTALPAHLIDEVKAEGHPWDANNVYRIPKEEGLRVDFPAPVSHPRLDLSLANNDDYRLQLLQGGDVVVWEQVIKAKRTKGGLTRVSVDLPAEVAARGYDAVRIYGLAADGRFSLGHLLPTAASAPPPKAKKSRPPAEAPAQAPAEAPDEP
ncbi:MAG: hypothetical protein IPK80_07480 [Nannocystis sp.]|nr:hypothetical protein [Nannocystis sp.]